MSHTEAKRSTIEVGDLVTWRQGGPHALGISECEVKKLGTVLDREGKEVRGAILDGGRFGKLCVRLCDLYKE